MATCPTCGAEVHPEHTHFHRSGYNATNFPPDVWPSDDDPLIWNDAPPRVRANTPDETALRWERPRIVSSRPTAAGTPKPNGWEA